MTLFKVFFALIASTNLFAYQDFSLDLGLDTRAFSKVDKNYQEDYNFTFNSLLSYKFKNDSLKILLESYVQADPVDTDRTFLIPKDFWIAHDDGTNIFKAGFQIINLSATEAFHPVDVINSRFLDSNLQKPSKIGEPMVSYKRLFGESSSFKIMYMPYFVEPFLATENSAYGPGVDFDEIEVFDTPSTFEGTNQLHQGALQFNTNVNGTDLSLTYINHIDRDLPSFIPRGSKTVDGETVAIVDALYFRKQQIGLTTQSVIFDWLLKTEMAFVDWEQSLSTISILSRDDYAPVAISLETTQSLSSGSEITYIIENQYVFGLDDAVKTYIFFQNDLLLGLRYAFNDVSGKEIFLSVINDLEYGKQFFFNLNYSQRISNSWKFETGLHFVDALRSNNYIGLDFIDSSDHVYFNLKKYF